MDLDPVLLARIQFGFTIAFHIVFPSFTIGLAAWIATLEGMWLASGRDRYHVLARFWTKIFAVSFAMGVVSGVVLSYELGTNWSRFSHVVGNVIGPMMAYEVLTAFFLEATFLGIMLFGWNRVPPLLHFAACALVALGTALSAFWIVSANSWMQAPAGHEVRGGIAYPLDWLTIVFSPTFPLRFLHMLVAAYLTTAFVVLAIGARWWLQGRFVREAETCVKMGLALAVALAPAQVLIGDSHGLKTAQYQPAKLAAMEGHWDGDRPASLVLFAIPNQAEARNDYEIAIPNLGSLIITHDLQGTFKGLNDFPPENRPPVFPVFWSFRIMVAIGLLMIATALVGGVLWLRGRLFVDGLFLRIAALLWPIGFIAVLFGWFTAEIGRQPWVATGVLRTAEAVSPVPAGSVAVSLALFVLVYAAVFSAGIVYIRRLLARGLDVKADAPRTATPSRPLAAANEAGAVPVTAGG